MRCNKFRRHVDFSNFPPATRVSPPFPLLQTNVFPPDSMFPNIWENGGSFSNTRAQLHIQHRIQPQRRMTDSERSPFCFTRPGFSIENTMLPGHREVAESARALFGPSASLLSNTKQEIYRKQTMSLSKA